TGHRDAGTYRDSQDAGDDTERQQNRYFVYVDQQHLYPDKDQDHRQAILQQREAVGEIREQEVHRAQTEDREYVRGQHDEGIGRHRKDRRNAVDRKNQIGDLHQHQHQKQRRRVTHAIAHDEETLAFQLFGHGVMPANPAHHRIRGEIGLVLGHPQHLDTSDQQEHAKQIQDPVELADQAAAEKHHAGTHGDGADNAIDQHSPLQLRRHRKETEDHQPDEDIVDGERFFDQVAGEKFKRALIRD